MSETSEVAEQWIEWSDHTEAGLVDFLTMQYPAAEWAVDEAIGIRAKCNGRVGILEISPELWPAGIRSRAVDGLDLDYDAEVWPCLFKMATELYEELLAGVSAP